MNLLGGGGGVHRFPPNIEVGKWVLSDPTPRLWNITLKPQSVHSLLRYLLYFPWDSLYLIAAVDLLCLIAAVFEVLTGNLCGFIEGEAQNCSYWLTAESASLPCRRDQQVLFQCYVSGGKYRYVQLDSAVRPEPSAWALCLSSVLEHCTCSQKCAQCSPCCASFNWHRCTGRTVLKKTWQLMSVVTIISINCQK